MLKNNIYLVTVLGGLVLVVLVWFSQGVSSRAPASISLVDGKIPPKLSALPMHMNFIDETTCLICHEMGKELKMMGETLIANKMTHEFRENCAECHRLP